MHIVFQIFYSSSVINDYSLKNLLIATSSSRTVRTLTDLYLVNAFENKNGSNC